MSEHNYFVYHYFNYVSARVGLNMLVVIADNEVLVFFFLLLGSCTVTQLVSTAPTMITGEKIIKGVSKWNLQI